MNIIRLSKNILTATVLALMATGLSSCYFRLSDDAKKQLKNELRRYPEEEADTVTYNPGEFHAVRSEDGFNDVTVIQTVDEFKVEVISYDTMADSIRVANEDGILTVGFTDGTLRIYGPVRVRVYTPILTCISSAGFGSTRISGFKGDSLSIKTVGSGDLQVSNLEISGELAIIGTGSGDHELMHITAGEMVIDKKGPGDGDYSDLNVGTLSVTSTGSGDTTLSGKADSVTFNKSGSGDIDASGLKAKNVKTQENGSGNLTID